MLGRQSVGDSMGILPQRNVFSVRLFDLITGYIFLHRHLSHFSEFTDLLMDLILLNGLQMIDGSSDLRRRHLSRPSPPNN
jgi:hypothetical protein